jgi:proteasome lid subunit RPN8/RPN11
MALRMTPAHDESIRRLGEEGYPHEVCGLLLGRVDSGGDRVVTEIYPLVNERDDSRENRYFVSGLSMLRAERHATNSGLDVVGYYHSHPNAPARPSGYDLDHATWPNISYPIVSVMEGKAVAIASWELDDDRSKFVPEVLGIAALDVDNPSQVPDLEPEDDRRTTSNGRNP